MGMFDSYNEVRGNRKDKPKHIKGIVCDVKNCVYHDSENYCSADNVAIGPSFATSSTDTVCATFKPKSL